MGKRRMFSLNIINSARFLKMPLDSQVLYFHLGLRADDDGIVEAYPVMKMIGNTDDNLDVLVAKKFIKVLNEDLVTFITDWTEHNRIRSDRKVDSIYKNLLLQIMPDVELLEAKPRADAIKQPGRPMDDKCPPKLSKVKLSKDKISKDKLVDTPPKILTPSAIMVNNINSWKTKGKEYTELIQTLKSKGMDNPVKEVDKFFEYWTELNKNGSKQRWQLQQTFEFKKRLLNWVNKKFIK